MSNLSYINELGEDVMTSEYLRNRKTCCKSGCLHCPYGYTLKKFGLTFEDFSDGQKRLADSISNKKLDISKYGEEFIKFIKLKDVVCGVMAVDKLFVKELYLKEHFQDQEIYKELVESYYFY